MDYLWAGILLISILYGSFTGNILAVSDAALSAAGEAISLCITTAGVLTLWTGLMEIAKSLSKNLMKYFQKPKEIY